VKTRIVGIDCATDAERTGVAAGWLDGEAIVVEWVALGDRQRSVVDLAEEALRPTEGRALLAIDAPLGWPSALSRSLIHHEAGAPLDADAHAMFRRATDRFVQAKLRKTPLEVGADRIARTAHAALAMLESLRKRTGLSLPLAWSPDFEGVAAIEVYPAATAIAHELPARGYKKPPDVAARKVLATHLRRKVALPARAALLHESADALDAALCVLAGADFLRGVCDGPEDLETARREGWIWFGSKSRLA
jgi:predicted nuclease with RNAse H fold